MLRLQQPGPMLSHLLVQRLPSGQQLPPHLPQQQRQLQQALQQQQQEQVHQQELQDHQQLPQKGSSRLSSSSHPQGLLLA
jgi:hypothetical protein